jgi:hypothetical protein
VAYIPRRAGPRGSDKKESSTSWLSYINDLQRRENPIKIPYLPVDSNGTEVEDGGGAAEYVSREPHLADGAPEDPAPQHGVGHVQRQHRHRHLHVNEF